jgi:hypothetical protein
MGQPFGAVIPVTGLNVGFVGQVSRTNAAEPSIAARQANAANTNNIAFGDAVVLIPDATGGTYVQIADWITNSSGLITPNPSPVAGSNPLPFAGIAVREVKTQLGYPLPPGTAQVGYYAPGQMCEVLERGSICVKIPVGTPSSNGPVYLRIKVNAAIPAGLLGDLEAAADVVLSTTMTAGAIGTAITVAAYTNLAVGMLATGFGIPAGTYITNVNTVTITLSQSTNAIVAAGTPVVFSNTLMLPNVVFGTGVLDANGVAEVTILSRSAS